MCIFTGEESWLLHWVSNYYEVLLLILWFTLWIACMVCNWILFCAVCEQHEVSIRPLEHWHIAVAALCGVWVTEVYKAYIVTVWSLYNLYRFYSVWEQLQQYEICICFLQFGNSMKSVFDHWNIGTSQWLRYVVYERLRSTLGVFMLSAFWHGFYPGYYLTFFSGALSVSVGRIVSQQIYCKSTVYNIDLGNIFQG